jgi:hypothetical protein
MYTQEKYTLLKGKYGAYASWAIWNESDKNDVSVIEENLRALHANYVFLGLNISKPLLVASWSNFHGGKNDRKLMYACNNTKLRGSYLTDIFKGIPEPKSAKLNQYIKVNPSEVIKNVKFFKQEMTDIEISTNTVFVVLGKGVLPFFMDYFYSDYNNKVICYPHYASHGTDKDWVEGLWNELGIKMNFVKR